jgi:hypothetical protein
MLIGSERVRVQLPRVAAVVVMAGYRNVRRASLAFGRNDDGVYSSRALQPGLLIATPAIQIKAAKKGAL